MRKYLILNDPMAKKDAFGFRRKALANRLGLPPRKKFSNLLGANGAKCRKISAVMRKKLKPADQRLATSAHILNAKAQTKQEPHKHVLSVARIPSAAGDFNKLS